MRRSLIFGIVLFAALQLRAEDKYYRVDFSPSGSILSSDLPVTKGTMVVFHEYPAGTLVSFPRAKIKRVVQVSTAAAEASNQHQDVIPIGNLAMQGGSQPATLLGRASSATTPPSASSTAARWNGYDSWAVVPDAGAPKSP